MKTQSTATPLEIATMRLRACVRELGYTASLVRRGDKLTDVDLICTIAPRVGDIVVARLNGPGGIFTGPISQIGHSIHGNIYQP